MSSSRFRKVTKNTIFHFVYYVIIIIFGFFVPKLIIETYGSDVNGLTSTITQMISFLTLIQAGIATAATFSLYKPIEEQNKVEIAKVLISTKRAFTRIGVFVLVLGIVVSFLIVRLINSALNPAHIYIACVIFLIKAFLDLYVTQTYRVFLTACQENYILSISYAIEHVVYYGLTLFIVYSKLHFLFVYLSLLIGCILKVAFLAIAFWTAYAKYKIDLPKVTKIKKVRGVNYAAYNEVAHSVVTGTIAVIISIRSDLASTSVYSVYLMIMNFLSIIGQVVYTSFSSSYGSITSTGDYEKINDVFLIFQYGYFAIVTWIHMCVSITMIPFLRIYTSNFPDSAYINYLLMNLIIIYSCFSAFRIPYNITVSANGLFKQTCLQPVITAVSVVILSLFITRFNFAYSLIGPIVFYSVNLFYQHFKLKKELSWFANGHFWRHFSVSASCVSISLFVGNYWSVETSSYIDWFCFALIVAAISLVIFVSLSFIVDNRSFRKALNFLISRILKKEKYGI